MIPGIVAGTAPVPPPLRLQIVNPGFETGDLTGWTTLRGSPSVVSATGTITNAHTGTYFFTGGMGSRAIVRQIVDVPSVLHGDIDADRVTLNYEAWVGAQTSEGDQTRFSVIFYNESDQIVGNYVPVAYSLEAWQLRGHSAKLPIGTRRIGLVLDARRFGSGNFADGYFDDIAGEFVIDEPTTVELPIRNPSGDEGSAVGWSVITGNLIATAGTSGDGTIALLALHYWYAGNTSLSQAYQQCAIPETAHESIDAGTATFNWSYFQCCTTTDRQRVNVQFYGGDGVTLLGSNTPTYANGGGGNTWVQRVHGPVTIPAGTRYARLIIDMDREDGTSNDGYCDAIRAWIDL